MLNSVTFHLGMNVHKDSIIVAVFRNAMRDPETVERLPYDLKKLKRLLDRLAREGSLRACYDCERRRFRAAASAHHCDLAAPSLIPTRPGDQRKHDHIDAVRLGRVPRAHTTVSLRAKRHDVPPWSTARALEQHRPQCSSSSLSHSSASASDSKKRKERPRFASLTNA